MTSELLTTGLVLTSLFLMLIVLERFLAASLGPALGLIYLVELPVPESSSYRASACALESK